METSIVQKENKRCTECDHCGMDMDMEPYCVQPDVIALRTKETGRDYPWGLDINRARPLCKGMFLVDRTPRQIMFGMK